MTSLALTTSTGATANIKAQPLPGGAVAVAHAFVDLTGAQISVALDATVQAVIASLQGLIVALPQVSLLPAYFEATANGAGFVAGDVLARVVLMDTSASPPVVASGGWVNSTQGTLLPSAPASGAVVEATRNVSAEIRFNAPRVAASGSLSAAFTGSTTTGASMATNVAAGAALALAVDGMSTAVMQVSGTWAGTISWYGSIDNGATYFSINASPFGAGLSGPSAASTTTSGQFEIAVGALTHVAAQMTTLTSGSPALVLAAANGAKITRVKAPANDPLPVLDNNNAPFTTTAALTVGAAAIAAGRSLRVYADAAGKVSFKTSAGTTLSRYFNAGENEFAFAVTQITAVTAPDGTAYAGATAIFENEA